MAYSENQTVTFLLVRCYFHNPKTNMSEISENTLAET